jgi:hypothetical protein
MAEQTDTVVPELLVEALIDEPLPNAKPTLVAVLRTYVERGGDLVVLLDAYRDDRLLLTIGHKAVGYLPFVDAGS